MWEHKWRHSSRRKGGKYFCDTVYEVVGDMVGIKLAMLRLDEICKYYDHFGIIEGIDEKRFLYVLEAMLYTLC